MTELKEWRARLTKILKRQPVQFAYLFGSHAMGRAQERSDIDVAIYPQKGLTRSQRFDLRLRIMNDIMDTLHEDRVDVVDLQEAPLPLRFSAIQPACLLFSRKETERVRFAVATQSEYFDRLPLIQRSTARSLARTARIGLQ